jgi:hypothetical protein
MHAHVAARCLHAVAELGVADALGDQPSTAAELARSSGTDPDALDRVLRLLAAQGIFARVGDTYVHNEASRVLQSRHPRSLRDHVRMSGSHFNWERLGQLEDSLRTGEPVEGGWPSMLAHYDRHPEQAQTFDGAMAGKAAWNVPAIVAAYDFSRFGLIVDIGGGRGKLIEAILAQTPAASGILFELPRVTERTTPDSPRLRLVAGDFFTGDIPAADAYVLMDVLHDWDDADAGRILANIRRGAPSHARLLVIERSIAEGPGPQYSKVLDILMLVMTGGRERTHAEFAALFADAGFRFERCVDTPVGYAIVEAAAA